VWLKVGRKTRNQIRKIAFDATRASFLRSPAVIEDSHLDS
jgi:hypothetical protein